MVAAVRAVSDFPAFESLNAMALGSLRPVVVSEEAVVIFGASESLTPTQRHLEDAATAGSQDVLAVESEPLETQTNDQPERLQTLDRERLRERPDPSEILERRRRATKGDPAARNGRQKSVSGSFEAGSKARRAHQPF